METGIFYVHKKKWWKSKTQFIKQLRWQDGNIIRVPVKFSFLSVVKSTIVLPIYLMTTLNTLIFVMFVGLIQNISSP